MERLLIVVFILILTVSGCSRDHGDRDEPPQCGLVSFKLALPRTYAAIDEQSIDKLDVIYFGSDGKFISRQLATSKGVAYTYEVLAPIATGMTVLLIANAHSEVESYTFTPTTTLADVEDNLLFKKDLGTLNNGTNLPMSAKLTSVTITATSTSFPITTVDLYRSVAKIEVCKDGGILDGKLNISKVYVVNAADNARLPLKMSGEIVQINQPTVITKVVYENASTFPFYIYESVNDGVPSISNASGWTKLVVAAKYNGAIDDSYYPIYFKDNSNSFSSVVRNHHYKFTIVSVSGPGYSTFDIAKQSRPVNLTVDVKAWNLVNNNIIFTGQYSIKLPTREVVFGAGKDLSTVLTIEHDIPTTNSWQFAVQSGTDSEPTSYNSDASSLGDGEFSFGWDSTNPTQPKLTITTRNRSSIDVDRYLYVKVLNIVFTIRVRKRCDVPIDWVEGGTTVTPLPNAKPYITLTDNSGFAIPSVVALPQSAGSLEVTVKPSRTSAVWKAETTGIFCSFSNTGPVNSISGSNGGKFTIYHSENTGVERSEFITVTDYNGPDVMARKIFRIVQQGRIKGGTTLPDWLQDDDETTTTSRKI